MINSHFSDNEPLVSILMTSFNREKYLGEAVESVLASSYQNFELIIVDDCSSDKTWEIALKLQALDQRIKVFKNEVNLGDYHNRNKAAEYAKGKYIKYVDADDLIYPYSLQIMVEYMEKFPSAGLGICDTIFNDIRPFPYMLTSKEIIRNQFLGRGVLESVGPTFTIFRKDVFEKLGRFSGARYIGDVEMWFKFAINFPVLILPPGLVWWRKHEGQEFQLGNNDYLFLRNKVKLNCLKESSKFFQEHEILKIESSLRRNISRTTLRLLKERKLELAFKVRKYFKISILDLVKAVLPSK